MRCTRHSIAVLALLVPASLAPSCATPPDRLTSAERAAIDPALRELSWLVGTWRASGAPLGADAEVPAQFEVWSVDENGLLVAANFQAAGDTTRPHQDMVLHPASDGAPVLEVTGYQLVGDRAIPQPKPSYRLVEATSTTARFEALAATLTPTILYQSRDGGDGLTVSFVLDEGNRKREFGVTFERVELDG